MRFSNKFRKATVFLPSGNVARFNDHQLITNDEALAEELRESPLYGKEIFEDKIIRSIATPITRGAITSAEKNGIDPERYEILKAKILKKDGTYIKGTAKELIEEYEFLKDKIGD